tara:strand:- start:233 stop:484 length:252 start_codon:yes stop_codon:yes gene_type:complete
MRKLRILDELEGRLVKFNNKLLELEPLQYDAENGGLDLDIYDKIQFYRSEIHYTKKKINYVKQGKTFLGNKLSSYNSGGHQKK